MTSDQTRYVTVQYRDKSNGDDVTRIYAASEDIARELDRKKDWLRLQNWLVFHIAKPLGLTRRHSYMAKTLTGETLQAWLEARGCQLGSPDANSPMEIRRSVLHNADESTDLHYGNEPRGDKGRQVHRVSAPLYEEAVQDHGALKRGERTTKASQPRSSADKKLPTYTL